MTGENSKTLRDAQNKCKKISAKLPIIKSESDDRFIRSLMSKKNIWVWLGMRRKGKMVWLDGTPAESSDRALFSAWKKNEPSSKKDEDCAYLNLNEGWNDNKCNYPSVGPFVLCQKERMKDRSSETEG